MSYLHRGDYYYQGERFDVYSLVGTRTYVWTCGPVSRSFFDSEEVAIVDARIYIREKREAEARSKNFPTVAEAGVW